MDWDDESRAAVEVALNEAEVLGLRLGPGGAWCDLLLHVPALPETGPIDPDPRRILRLTSPAEVKVLLRPDQTGPARYGPVIPLAGLDAVEDFFASLTWFGPMYGWRFLDNPSLTHDWPAQPSLIVTTRPGPAHTRCTGSASAGGKRRASMPPTASRAPSPSKISRSGAPVRPFSRWRSSPRTRAGTGRPSTGTTPGSAGRRRTPPRMERPDGGRSGFQDGLDEAVAGVVVADDAQRPERPDQRGRGPQAGGHAGRLEDDAGALVAGALPRSAISGQPSTSAPLASDGLRSAMDLFLARGNYLAGLVFSSAEMS